MLINIKIVFLESKILSLKRLEIFENLSERLFNHNYKLTTLLVPTLKQNLNSLHSSFSSKAVVTSSKRKRNIGSSSMSCSRFLAIERTFCAEDISLKFSLKTTTVDFSLDQMTNTFSGLIIPDCTLCVRESFAISSILLCAERSVTTFPTYRLLLIYSWYHHWAKALELFVVRLFPPGQSR